MSNSVTPIRPEESEVTPEVEKILRERLATFERDKQSALPWNEVLRRVTLKPTP